MNAFPSLIPDNYPNFKIGQEATKRPEYIRVPYLRKIIWQPYDDTRQPEKNECFITEDAHILSDKKYNSIKDELAKARESIKSIFVECLKRDHTLTADEVIDSIYNIVSPLCTIKL